MVYVYGIWFQQFLHRVCTNIFPSTHLHLHLDVHLGAHRDVDRGPGGVGVVDVPHQVGLRVPNVKNKPGNRHKGMRDGCETDHTRPNACQIWWTAPVTLTLLA